MEFQNANVDIESLPKVEESTFKGLHAELLTLNIIGTALFLLVVLIGVLIFRYFVLEDPASWIKMLLFGGFSVFAALRIFIAVLGHRKKKFALRERDILYRSGLIFQRTITVPFNRVQHISVSQGPIERGFELASLNIFTAGGSGSDLTIPGLRPIDAEEIRDFILQKSASYAAS